MPCLLQCRTYISHNPSTLAPLMTSHDLSLPVARMMKIRLTCAARRTSSSARTGRTFKTAHSSLEEPNYRRHSRSERTMKSRPGLRGGEEVFVKDEEDNNVCNS